MSRTRMAVWTKRMRAPYSSAQAVDQPAHDGCDLGARGLRILGAGDVERGLVERPEQHVRERPQRLLRDLARRARGAEDRLGHAHGIAPADLAPALPAEDRRRVEQDDPLDLGVA